MFDLTMHEVFDLIRDMNARYRAKDAPPPAEPPKPYTID